MLAQDFADEARRDSARIANHVIEGEAQPLVTAARSGTLQRWCLAPARKRRVTRGAEYWQDQIDA